MHLIKTFWIMNTIRISRFRRISIVSLELRIQDLTALKHNYKWIKTVIIKHGNKNNNIIVVMFGLRQFILELPKVRSWNVHILPEFFFSIMPISFELIRCSFWSVLVYVYHLIRGLLTLFWIRFCWVALWETMVSSMASFLLIWKVMICGLFPSYLLSDQ